MLKCPNFLGNFPLTCLCLSSQWAVCLMYYTTTCALTRSIECTWFRVHMIFLCGDIGQHVPKMSELFGKFPIDVPLPILPMGNMSHVLHQKMRLHEIYPMHLVPSLYRIPIGSYRGNSLTSLLKVPNLFIGIGFVPIGYIASHSTSKDAAR